MADPVLATPAIRPGFLSWKLFRCPPPSPAAWCTPRRTVANSLSFTAPVNQRSNIDTTAAPTNLAPTVNPALRLERLHKTLAANHTFVTGNDTAAAAIVWAAPGYPHSNTGVYP